MQTQRPHSEKKKDKKKHQEKKRERNINMFIKTYTDIFSSAIYAEQRGEGEGGC